MFWLVQINSAKVDSTVYVMGGKKKNTTKFNFFIISACTTKGGGESISVLIQTVHICGFPNNCMRFLKKKFKIIK